MPLLIYRVRKSIIGARAMSVNMKLIISFTKFVFPGAPAAPFAKQYTNDTLNM